MRFIPKHFFLLFIFLATPSVTAQQARYALEDLGKDLFFAYDSLTKPSIYSDSLHFHFQNGNFKSHPIPKAFDFSIFEDNKTPQDFYLAEAQGVQYFILRGLGIVFKVDESGFSRIDNSSELRNNFRSSIFIYNKDIYSFGGYGYWNYHGFVVNFNAIVKEWKAININKRYLPLGRAYQYGGLVGDDFIFFGGKSNDGLLQDVVKLDLKNNRFKYLGELSSTFDFPLTAPPFEINLAPNKKLYVHTRIKKSLLVDFNDLTFSIDTTSFKLFNSIDPLYPTLSANDSIYYITEKVDGSREMVAVSKNYLSGLFSEQKNILRHWDRIRHYVFVFLSLLAAVFVSRFVFLLRKKSKFLTSEVLLQDNYLTCGGELVILNAFESQLLRLLAKNSKVPFSKVLTLQEFESLSEKYAKTELKKNIARLVEKINSEIKLREKIKIKVKTDRENKKEFIISLKGKIIVYSGWIKYVVQEFIS